jgi:quercetin dioxygenase-like cupin family protein
MSGKINTIQESKSFFVLGETLRPLLTNAMGSAIEIFDTSGPADCGPPTHTHPWEEVYFVLAGELEVTVGNSESQILSAGGVAHVPAGIQHGYRNVTDDCHFLTIVTRGNAACFFEQVASEVEMSPPDIVGVTRIGLEHGIEFLD